MSEQIVGFLHKREVAALRAAIILAPWDRRRRSFLDGALTYVERCLADLPGIVRDGRDAVAGRNIEMAKAVERRAKGSRLLSMEPFTEAPPALPHPPVRRGPRPRMTSGQILAEMLKWFGEAATKETLLQGIAHSRFIASTGGPRPLYYLERLPRMPEDWLRAAGVPEGAIEGRASRFLRRRGRWVDGRRLSGGLHALTDWLTRDLLRAMGSPDPPP